MEGMWWLGFATIPLSIDLERADHNDQLQEPITASYNYFFQQVHGNVGDSDEIKSWQESIQSSQTSQSSEEIESSQDDEVVMHSK